LVVPIDLDKNSQKIVGLAILMAKKMRSEICFFYSIYFIEFDSMSYMASHKFSYGDYNTDKSSHAEKIIKEFIKRAVKPLPSGGGGCQSVPVVHKTACRWCVDEGSLHHGSKIFSSNHKSLFYSLKQSVLFMTKNCIIGIKLDMFSGEYGRMPDTWAWPNPSHP
jgi:hypothetical protein